MRRRNGHLLEGLEYITQWKDDVQLFRVGSFDPYSDDPRLAVKKVLFCGDSGVLVVGGTAGQVMSAPI